jgi:hypothetical protein
MDWIKRILKRSVQAEIYVISHLHVVVDKFTTCTNKLNLSVWKRWLNKRLDFYYGLNGDNKMFNFKYWIQVFQGEPGYNDATNLGVVIHRKPASRWQAIGVHHLTGYENNGNHNIFCDVLDSNGERIQGARLAMIKGNLAEVYAHIDKPDYEPGTNFPMFGDSEHSVHVSYPSDNPLLSDEVTGIRINHASNDPGNSLGHNSFFVVFQEVDGDGPIDPPPVEATYSVIGELQVTVNKAWLSSLPSDTKGNVTFMTRIKDDK